MNQYEAILLAGALFTLYVSRELPRAWTWIAIGAASCVASSMYWSLGFRDHTAFTFFADVFVCLALYAGARERWELILFFLYKMSAFISVVYFASTRILGLHVPSWLYASGLELINAAALITIGATAIMDRNRADGPAHARYRYSDFRKAGFSLREARDSDPWHKVHK